ncbi:hypothetical protein V2J56_09025 [Georgenia sp. MJ206]|uniref:hypothetical protein n=1 Tax=Georgenia wangjunii TaxID=3117730 RepID=UPI002F25F7C7
MSTAWQKRYNLDRELGRPRMMDAGPVLEHLDVLLEAGWTPAAIADAAGLSRSVTHAIAARRQATVRVATGRALLGVRPSTMRGRPNPRGFVPAVGTRRRIEALLALGWPHTVMSAECGFATHVKLHQRGECVSRATHDGAVAMYERWSMTPGPSATTRTRAAALGYAPPLAWDDIDDPDEVPAHDARPASGGREGIDLDDFAFLVRSGELPDRAAARCGVDLRSVATRAYRYGRRDVLTLIGIREMERVA